MNDGYGTSHVVILDAPRALPGGLSTEEFAALRAIKKRKRLETSAIYRARAHAIRDLTSALGYHRPARPAPRPAGEFLRVICWNIERGKRLDGIRAYLTHHRAIREADVVLSFGLGDLAIWLTGAWLLRRLGSSWLAGGACDEL